MATAREVAEWMAGELNRVSELYQEDAAYEVERLFGKQFLYENENGNMAIDRAVLREFRRLTESDVVWEPSERYWRKREPRDPIGKRRAE